MSDPDFEFVIRSGFEISCKIQIQNSLLDLDLVAVFGTESEFGFRIGFWIQILNLMSDPDQGLIILIKVQIMDSLKLQTGWKGT